MWQTHKTQYKRFVKHIKKKHKKVCQTHKTTDNKKDVSNTYIKTIDDTKKFVKHIKQHIHDIKQHMYQTHNYKYFVHIKTTDNTKHEPTT